MIKEYSNKYRFLVLVVIAGCFAAHAVADEVKPPAQSFEVLAFVFQGRECPTGSYPYKGPEAKRLQKEGTGLIYCRLMSECTVLKIKADRKTCPEGTTPYQPDDVFPDEGYMWCKGRLANAFVPF